MHMILLTGYSLKNNTTPHEISLDGTIRTIHEVIFSLSTEEYISMSCTIPIIHRNDMYKCNVWLISSMLRVRK